MEKTTQENILSVRGIKNRFGTHIVHDGVSFDVKRGEVIGIIGGSGSGKSVLLKTMVGLHRPNAGEVLIEGRRVKDIPNAEIATLFGVLFQQGALFSSLTVAQNVILPLREHTGLAQADMLGIAELKIGLAGLPAEAALKYPSELSGGMVKRASLARAIVFDPLLLFLDEPTAGLDPLTASGFDRLILNLNRNLGITVVIVTHDLDTLYSICDRVAVLVDKKLIIDTLPNLEQHKHPWIWEYFHSPRARASSTITEQ